MQNGAGRVAEFRAEVAAFRKEYRNDGGGGPQPHIELLQRVVVHQVELDVLVAPALAGRGIRLAQQVQLDAAGILRGSARGRIRFGLRILLRRILLPAGNAPHHKTQTQKRERKRLRIA